MKTLQEVLSKKTPMLQLTTPMMHGGAVARLQESLSFFTTITIDGVFGNHTQIALCAVQRIIGVRADGVYGPVTKRALSKHLQQRRCITLGLEWTQKSVLDISDLHQKPALYAYHRYWDFIHGVTLHQTGCDMSDNPFNWGRVNAHYGLMRDGTALLLNDPIDMIWHANGLSPYTIGVEIEGNYCGIDGDLDTLWKGGGGPHRLNDKMIAGAALIRDDIAGRFTEHKKTWRYIYAHRQSSGTRRADPGEEIWNTIAADWAANTECQMRPEYKRGTGAPLPKQWGDYGAEY